MKKKIFARIGFADVIVPIEDAFNNDKPIIGKDTFLVGYEDEDGNECDENGNPLNQTNNEKTN